MSSLGNRMKKYENHYRQKVLPRMPCILRLDGKAFHSVTKGCDKPFDVGFMDAMDSAASAVLNVVQNARMAYVQSDEISILLVDFNTFQSQQWFGGNVQKMVSVSAGAASVAFTEWNGINNPGLFDSRVFTLPKEEVTNYFIWRQQDCIRNAVQMVARAHFSHKECHKKNCDQLQEMLFQKKGVNFKSDYTDCERRGRCFFPHNASKNACVDVTEGVCLPENEAIYSSSVDNITADFTIPDFTKDRDYIESRLHQAEG